MPLPLVTVGVCTNRPWCLDWLRWNLDRITYGGVLELVVAYPPAMLEELALRLGGAPLRSVHPALVKLVPVDGPVGVMRNAVIAAASGELLTWMDDDDWHHPMRIHALVEAHSIEPAWQVGFARSYLLHTATRTGLRFESKRPVNGSSLFVTDALRAVAYDDGFANSDARYLAKLRARFGEPVAITRPVLAVELHALYLRHGLNTSEGVPYGTPMTLESIARRAGLHWNDSEARIEEFARVELAAALAARSEDLRVEPWRGQAVETLLAAEALDSALEPEPRRD